MKKLTLSFLESFTVHSALGMKRLQVLLDLLNSMYRKCNVNLRKFLSIHKSHIRESPLIPRHQETHPEFCFRGPLRKQGRKKLTPNFLVVCILVVKIQRCSA